MEIAPFHRNPAGTDLLYLHHPEHPDHLPDLHIIFTATVATVGRRLLTTRQNDASTKTASRPQQGRTFASETESHCEQFACSLINFTPTKRTLISHCPSHIKPELTLKAFIHGSSSNEETTCFYRLPCTQEIQTFSTYIGSIFRSSHTNESPALRRCASSAHTYTHIHTYTQD